MKSADEPHFLQVRERMHPDDVRTRACLIRLRTRSRCHNRSFLRVAVGGCLVGAIGLEPTTPTMSRWCSNQLSYAPEFVFEPSIVAEQDSFYRRFAQRTPWTSRTRPSTLFRPPESATSTVNVIHAV